ncbi:RNA polymerase sigma factor [Asticcacaulis benevestitus]|uniref:RNA polymerase sigma factor n=1 Tax=Asticcacaulis benevestitus TaxID=347481 RepID=UPI000A6D86C2|nr:sigma-70 family RNA polymerase sigma factor [Asticcacaulis benevestitus]
MGVSKEKFEIVDLNQRFRSALIAFFVRRIGSQTQAEDLTQEVFVRMTNLKTDDVQNLEGYLFQIARNLLRDTHRRDNVRNNYEAIVRGDDQRDTESRHAERIIIARQALEKVAVILDGLPERTRSIFILHRMEAMARKDIAQAYGITISAVEKHLGKAMALLATKAGDL